MKKLNNKEHNFSGGTKIFTKENLNLINQIIYAVETEWTHSLLLLSKCGCSNQASGEQLI